ncbi:hypothetical protein D6D13_04418, partial [Aureobasidium pullulans]
LVEQERHSTSIDQTLASAILNLSLSKNHQLLCARTCHLESLVSVLVYAACDNLANALVLLILIPAHITSLVNIADIALGIQIFCMFHKCASFRLTSLFFFPFCPLYLSSISHPALLFVIRQSNLLCAQLLTINLFSTSSNMDPSICAPEIPLYEGRGEVTERDGFIKDVNDLCALVNQGIEHIPDFPRDHTPTILSLWAASGDEQRMKNAGIDMAQTFWRMVDIQPIARQLRPNGVLASKPAGSYHKLIEASREFGLRMTTQSELDQVAVGAGQHFVRTESFPVQHNAQDDAFNTVKLTVIMIKEDSPVWPPKGPNVRIFAVDLHPVRGSKYPHYISEWGFAYIDTDTIRAHPDDWHLYITTGHAVVH